MIFLQHPTYSNLFGLKSLVDEMWCQLIILIWHYFN